MPGSSLPIVGNTLSLAERETKRENGTSHTQSPKYDAISVNVGRLEGSYRDAGYDISVEVEKCVNQTQ